MAAGAAMAACEVLQAFGVPVVDVKPLLSKKALPVLFEHTHVDVRDAAKELSLELFRWVGPAVKACLKSIKPVQLKELEGLWEGITPGTASPIRFPRSVVPGNSASPDEQGGESDNDSDGGADSGPAAPIDACVTCDIQPHTILPHTLVPATTLL